MKHALFALFCLMTAFSAHGQVKPWTGKQTTPNPDYDAYYIVEGTKKTEPEAFMSAVSGKSVYHCIRQEVKMNKSGKGASLSNVKKNL